MNVAKQQKSVEQPSQINITHTISLTLTHLSNQRKQTSFDLCLKERVTEGIGGGATSSRLKAYGA